MGQGRQIDESNTPTEVIVRSGAAGPVLGRVTLLAVSFVVFCAATAAVVVEWAVQNVPGPNDVGETIAVFALFTLALAALGASLFRDYHNRRNLQTEQLVRNWLVYLHDETRKADAANNEAMLQEIRNIQARGVAAVNDAAARNLAVIEKMHQETIRCLVALAGDDRAAVRDLAARMSNDGPTAPGRGSRSSNGGWGVAGSQAFGESDAGVDLSEVIDLTRRISRRIHANGA